MVSNSFGCTNQSDTLTFERVGIDGLISDALFKVYPNPTSSFLQIATDSNLEFNVELYDLTGKNVIDS
ncbi:MAG: T9SS type A sorting domain-containing protein [Bacteroidia bacterium]